MGFYKVRSRPTSRIFGIVLILLAAAIVSHQGLAQKTAQETAERDRWQHPAQVLDALEIRAGSIVADVGAGDGYFTFHLAKRVGPTGRVYAEDIVDKELAKIRSVAAQRHLTQIETIPGTPSDPRLPADALDAILVMNAFHEMENFDEMLQGLLHALKPGGLLAIIEAEDKMGEPRSAYQKRHKLPEELVRQDAARNGFQFLRKLPGFTNPDRDRTYYFLLFAKPKTRCSKWPGPTICNPCLAATLGAVAATGNEPYTSQHQGPADSTRLCARWSREPVRGHGDTLLRPFALVSEKRDSPASRI
ncbi:MAG TPA: methyltransferase domain-containing protein [Candidatus Dormibacteraeota bacterium]|nr:methyltransferase domain-containing protein [Candidatus Dormibacteraeota bacterium]